MFYEDRTRQEVARLAALLIYERLETEYIQAKRKAARQMGLGARGGSLPSNDEIRDCVDELARIWESDEERAELLTQTRVAALWLMRGALREFRPRLFGPVLEGRVRRDLPIALHVFCADLFEVAETLRREGFHWKIERQQLPKPSQGKRSEELRERILIEDRFDYQLSIHDAEDFRAVARDFGGGKSKEWASAKRLETLIRREHPSLNLAEAFAQLDAG
jgi:hypothetical protein